jgi:hypothetical protein
VRTAAVALLAAATLGVAGCGGEGGEAGASDELTVELAEQNGSRESGTATLNPDGDATRVVIELQNGTSEPQPAHIHPGSCADLDPKPKYGLANVVDGKSETTVDAPLSDLKAGAFAINVHKSAAEVQTYVSCGDLGGKAGASEPDEDADAGYGY